MASRSTTTPTQSDTANHTDVKSSPGSPDPTDNSTSPIETTATAAQCAGRRCSRSTIEVTAVTGSDIATVAWAR